MEPLRPEDPRQIGSYLVQARIGSGGMGEVFLGRSPGGRAVAIKVIHAALANDPEFRARFRREVGAARAVTGAFTAPLVDADPEAEQPWLATTFLPGISLDDAVAGFGPWPPPPVYLLGAGLAEALVSIHRAGVVHRDLKPSNILLTRDGPRVIDFGIARAAEAATITQTGMAVGSPSYMAPEQATGGETGPPGDVFALGAVLTYAATGKAPFGGGSIPQLIYRIVHEQPDLDGIADPGLRALVAACLDKDPSRRPTAVQLLEGLARPPAVPHPSHAAPGSPTTGWPGQAPTPGPQGIGWLPPPIAAAVAQRAGAPLPTPPPTTPLSRGRPSRRALLVGGAIGGATLAVAGTGAFLWHNRPRSPILWSFDVPDSLSVGPIVAGNTVFVTGSETFALDPRDGRIRWRAPDKIARNSPPIAQDGRVFIYDGGSLNAFTITTGDRLWSEPVKTFGLAPIPTAMNGLVCMNTSQDVGDYALHAFDAATGQTRWRYQLEDIPHNNAEGQNGTFYVGSGGELLYAVDATGRLRWQQQTGAKVASTPAVAGGLVFVVTEGYQVLAFDAATGRRRWRNTSGATSGGALAEDPVHAVIAGTVYIRGAGGRLRAIDAATGRDRWAFAAGDKASSPTISGGFVFVHDGENTLHALDAAAGKTRWTHRVKTAPGERPSVMNNTLYLGTTDGVLGFDPPTGRVTFNLDESDFPEDFWVYVDNLTPWAGALYCSLDTNKLVALRTT
ncbi:MAG TPA: serine/threonine-protein kinase [Streptosporangiaceae bacterium]|nr:serine/threonine-protein kinase [Streptosporangiaceae bacterium]